MINETEIYKDINTGLSLEALKDLLIQENNKQINCQYYEKNDFISKFSKQGGLSFLHLNIRSLSKHFDNLQNLLSTLGHRFRIIALSESRHSYTSSVPHYLDLENYSLISNETEAAAGGTAIYVCNTVCFKVRNDISSVLYKSKTEKGHQNTIVGCVYKHPTMPANEFTDFYLAPIIDKINKEKKRCVFLGDFNINLLEYNKKVEVDNFIDTICSHNIFPTVLLPTRITADSTTLIDNILISQDKKLYESGNLLVGISDHLPQFLIPIAQKNNLKNSHHSYKDWKSWNIEGFKQDFVGIDWKNFIKPEKRDPDYSFNQFYIKLQNLIEL